MVSLDLIWTTDVNVTRYRSCSKTQEVLDQAWRNSVPGKRMLSITWFEQHKSLIRWETKRDNYSILVHRQGNQEAMPVGTDRRLSGEWLLCSCQIHLPMYSTPCIHWKDDDGFVFAALHAIDHTFRIIVTMLYLAEVRGLVVLKQLISQRTPTEHCCA